MAFERRSTAKPKRPDVSGIDAAAHAIAQYAEDYASGPRSGPPYWSDDYMRGQAAKQNLDILYDDDNTLLIDIDEQYEMFVVEHRLSAIWEKLYFLEDLGVLSLAADEPQVLRSKSGNTHVVIKLWESMPSVERRVLVQAYLGSDLKRAALSLAGIIHGQEHPNVLFRPRA